MNNVSIISIDTDLENSQYILSGDVPSIQNYKRAKTMLKYIDAEFKNNKIYIPFSTEENPNDYDDKETQYQRILDILDEFNFKHRKTEQTKKFIEHYEQENSNFKVFSQKAKNIRNDIHQTSDFNEFKNIITKNLKRELYLQQLLSAYHLAFAQHACNFSVPGAGKTSIVYGAYAYLKNLPKDHPKYVNRLLIISPLAAFAPWKNEYKDCFGNSPTVKELVGINADERRIHFLTGNEELTLISYQSASNESDVKEIKGFLNRVGNSVMLILDEAHRIKNVVGGKWAKSTLEIARYAKSRVVLTGTPAPNGYYDLHNLYKFIWPTKNIIGYTIDDLKNLSKHDYMPSAKQDIKELINNISPFFLRIKKSHLELPEPIINEPIMVDMSESQRTIYEHIEGKYIDYFKQKTGSSDFINKLRKAKLIRLMQSITNIGLLKRPLDEYIDNKQCISNGLAANDIDIMQLIQDFNPEKETPPKFNTILDILRNSILKKNGPDGKTIIWTIFVQNIFDLKKFLNHNDIDCEVLYGKTPSENQYTEDDILTREKIISRFHKKDCPYKVIIANPFAVGESISLHKACHNAIYLEKNFNVAVYIQSKDRIHRFGLNSNDKINYYYILTQDTIDQTIHNRLIEKENRMLEIIEQDIPLLNLNMEENCEDEDDIKAIINDYYAKKSS